ncbi:MULTISPECIES: carbonic anhydrase [Cupriavidus]|uniref:Carbonic anhydrase n=1 Tax=Cupriavidus oxalaticus TaxID=96344 RepID=A0A4P7LDJ2_9BURK|nr:MULTISPECIES: carbonic anhydrase [Cupriavidus]MBF6990249.1 carbonic anhydrase [Cupriavidus sp. IK-TO18]QBY50517.1 carbonic anhydrase [Cupriavidus oxalaticus]TDF64164.1 carbonic anhydrase [Cupriavidus sp. L7L]
MHQIEHLLKGFERFQQRYFDDAPSLFDALRTGQQPPTLLIGCCDSRVDPALLLGCDPGDLFTVRNIGNLVPPCTGRHEGSLHGVSAAIQFAVEQLQVDRIIVMGHGGCGGIRALLAQPADAGDHPPEEGDEADYLGAWVRIAAPARRQVEQTLADASPAQRQRACEQAAILVSLRNLQTFPFVRRALEAGRLTLHGWYFDLQAGALLAYSQRADAFLPLVCPLPITAAQTESVTT